MLWLAPMKLPGRDLPEDGLWQLDEQVRIQPEDYDRILEMGWSPWFGQYIGKYLGEAAAAGAALQQKAPRWVGEFMGRGYVVFSASTVDHPYEHLCGGRTVKEFTLDLFRMPDKVAGRDGRHHGREARADPADRPRRSGPSATGWAAGGRRPSSSRRGCGTASCGPT